MTAHLDLRARYINRLGLSQPETQPIDGADVRAAIRRIIESNWYRDFDHGMTGCLQVFAAAVEARTYKRMAAEALLICGRFRDAGLPRKGWQWWFNRAQQMRRKAMELGR